VNPFTALALLADRFPLGIEQHKTSAHFLHYRLPCVGKHKAFGPKNPLLRNFKTHAAGYVRYRHQVATLATSLAATDSIADYQRTLT
jgi:hypothetical protein